MLCPACGYENLPGVDFCQECLSSLSHLDVSQSTVTESRIEKAILKEKVYQILSPSSLMVSPSTPLKEIIKLLADENRSSIVIGEKGKIDGIFDFPLNFAIFFKNLHTFLVCPCMKYKMDRV